MITRTIVVILGYLCVAGFVANGQSCNATKTCSSGQQCMTNPTCNWGMCTTMVCSADKKLNTSTCVTPTVNFGGNCSFSSDCKGTYTWCNTSMQCSCPSDFTVNGDRSDCMPPPPPTSPPKTPLNGNCTIDTCGDHASCASNNTCQCDPTYIRGNNNIDCRALVPKDPCSNVTDCGANAQYYSACKNANCNNGTYQCNSGYWWVTSDTLSFQSGCVPNNVSANVTSGQSCADGTGNNNYLLCAPGLTCLSCPEYPSGTGTCQSLSPPTTTQKTGSASNVQVNIMALAAALAFFRFAA